MPQKSYMHSPIQAAKERRWHHIDAKGLVLGRIATKAADLLRGKLKPTYTDYVDCGDFVVVTNAKHVKLTGNKLEQKFYFSHSGYAGGAKVTPMKRQMERDPRKVVMLAVRRMLPKNRLARKQMVRLKIYVADTHPHGTLNSKAGQTTMGKNERSGRRAARTPSRRSNSAEGRGQDLVNKKSVRRITACPIRSATRSPLVH